MATPSVSDMKTSLEDARFFYTKMEPIIRGPEQEQKEEKGKKKRRRKTYIPGDGHVYLAPSEGRK